MFMGHDARAQSNFFAPCATLQLSSTAPNAPSDLQGQFGLGLNAACEPFSSPDVMQWNSGGLITFAPKEWTVAKAGDVDIGAKVGKFDSKAILGLLNNGCNTILNVPFDLFNGTIDQGSKVDKRPVLDENGNPNPDLLFPMRDVDGNGVPDSAEKWPSYLNAVAERAGMKFDGLRARFVGVNTNAVSGTTVVLNFLVFEPGSTVSDEIQLDPLLGYPAVTILQDPSSVASPKDPPNDFCAPLWTSFSLSGTANGKTFRSNPGDGLYNFVTWVNPANDADNDGIENSLDPCATTPTTDWNPRGNSVQNPGDQDGDGIPDACDPQPTSKDQSCNSLMGISNSDEDCDGWANRADNCPLIANGVKTRENPAINPNPPDNQVDDDGDGIGNACDPHPAEDDGANLPVCIVMQATVGAGGTASLTPEQVRALTPCDPFAPITPQGQTPAPATPTPVGQTPAPAGGGTGIGGAGSTGIGSLAPDGTSVPAWATMLTALGIIGFVIGFGLTASRFLRRRE
jgi:hypothetical protein